MKYFITIGLLVLAGLPLYAQTDVVLTAPDVKGYPVNRVPFRLVEDGNLLTDLDTTRLRVFEDGVALPYSVNCPAQTARSASVAIGLERSLDAAFGPAKQAALRFIEAMQFTDVRNSACFWAFATSIDRVVDVVRDSSRLWHAVNGTNVANFPFNGTPLWETMHRAVEDIVQYGTEPTRAVVFFTDGRNNTSYFSRSREDVINRALIDGVRIYVVAVNASVADRNALSDMCDRTGGFMRLESDPEAQRDIYADLIRPNTSDYWCTLEYRSPLCPNGSSRNITLEYQFLSVGTVDETVGYTAPYRERELTKLNFFVSPRHVRFEAGDTLRVTFGVSPDAAALVSDMRLELTHPGLQASGQPEVLEGIAGWSVVAQAAPSFTSIELAPPSEMVADSGMARWFRLTFVAQTSDTIEIQPALVYDKTQCLVLLRHDVLSAYRTQLDTVVAAWRSEVAIPFRLLGAIPPEGVQRIDVEIGLNTAELAPVAAGGSFLSGLPPGWVVARELFATQATAGLLNLELRGPPLDSPLQLFSLHFQVEEAAAYLNAVTVFQASANDFAIEGLTAAGSGLVVIRDSCRNNIAVKQQGLAVQGPSPNPARDAALFSLKASEPMDVSIRVYNALGVQCGLPMYHTLSQGNSVITLPLGTMDDGVYLVRFQSKGGVVTARMVVRR